LVLIPRNRLELSKRTQSGRFPTSERRGQLEDHHGAVAVVRSDYCHTGCVNSLWPPNTERHFLAANGRAAQSIDGPARGRFRIGLSAAVTEAPTSLRITRILPNEPTDASRRQRIWRDRRIWSRTDAALQSGIEATRMRLPQAGSFEPKAQKNGRRLRLPGTASLCSARPDHCGCFSLPFVFSL
jgi:hypothetical protein